MPTTPAHGSILVLLFIYLYSISPLCSSAYKLGVRHCWRKPYCGLHTRSTPAEGCELVKHVNPPSNHAPSLAWSAIYSRASIETVIHTGDCEDYDVNCVQYRKARYWRELSTPEIEEEIRKVRKVLAKIELYRKTKNPALHPSSLGNTRRTLAQLLFIRHERHLASLREKENLKKLQSLSNDSSAAGDAHE